jgi:hypothetical protein
MLTLAALRAKPHTDRLVLHVRGPDALRNFPERAVAAASIRDIRRERRIGRKRRQTSLYEGVYLDVVFGSAPMVFAGLKPDVTFDLDLFVDGATYRELLGAGFQEDHDERGLPRIMSTWPGVTFEEVFGRSIVREGSHGLRVAALTDVLAFKVLSPREKDQLEADIIREELRTRANRAAVTHITPSGITVQVGSRTVNVGGEALILRPEAPYFVYSESIRAWQPPHEREPFSPQDREEVLRAIREYMESRQMSYVVDPTDEQYRSL